MTTPSTNEKDLEIAASPSQSPDLAEVAIGMPNDPPTAATPTLSPATGGTPMEVEMEKGESKTDTTNSAPAKASNSQPTSIRYPDACLCPISKAVFRMPVVAADGVTYEESAILSRAEFQDGLNGTPSTETQETDIEAASDEENPQENPQTKHKNGLYRNRAMEGIIDEQTTKAMGIIQRRGRWSQLAAWTASTQYEDRPLPDGYYCPITLNLIHEPVIDPEGYSYEKVAIESWIRVNGASPVTRQQISLEDLRPNLTLAELMKEEAGISKTGEISNTAVHPVWKQWREESPPEAPCLELEGTVNATSGASAQFPMTPEQLEAATRARRIQRYKKYHIWTVVLFLLALMAFIVPGFATVLLVVILIGVVLVTVVASSNRRF